MPEMAAALAAAVVVALSLSFIGCNNLESSKMRS